MISPLSSYVILLLPFFISCLSFSPSYLHSFPTFLHPLLCVLLCYVTALFQGFRKCPRPLSANLPHTYQTGGSSQQASPRANPYAGQTCEPNWCADDCHGNGQRCSPTNCFVVFLDICKLSVTSVLLFLTCNSLIHILLYMPCKT
jgi:hypothetical protein